MFFFKRVVVEATVEKNDPKLPQPLHWVAPERGVIFQQNRAKNGSKQKHSF